MGKVRDISDRILESLPDDIYCRAINLRNRVRRYQLNIESTDSGTFKANAVDGSLIFSRRTRYFYYKSGISTRLNVLSQNYLLNQIEFRKNDCVIDCGANIGEIGLYLKKWGVNYHPFEPEQIEADCCDQNNFDGQNETNRIALWNENTVLKFYSKPDSADSSIFPADDGLDVLSIPAVTLESYLQDNNIEHVRLAKIEAEGAEPEVLDGAQPVLHKIDFVSVDCGFERGKDKEPTFFESNKILTGNNFEIVDADLRRNAFLFKRRDL